MLPRNDPTSVVLSNSIYFLSDDLNHNVNFALKKVVRDNFFKLGFSPCKAEQPLQSTELQEKETQTD